MKSQILRTVWRYISGEAEGGNLRLITLGSERVKHFFPDYAKVGVQSDFKVWRALV